MSVPGLYLNNLSPDLAMGLAGLAQIVPGITPTGKPGEFNIPGMGVRKLGDVRQDRIYDRCAIPATSTAGKTIVFFRDTQGKNKLDTNMDQQSVLAQGVEAVIYRASFVPIPSCPVKDLEEILAQGYGALVFDSDTVVLEGPIVSFPQAYGMYGSLSTTKNDTTDGVATNGMPSPGAQPRLLVPQMLTEKRSFRFDLVFPDGCTLPSTVASKAWVILDAVILRPLK